MLPPAAVALALVGVAVILLLVARVWRKPSIASLALDESAARLKQMQQETTDLVQAKSTLERDLAVEREKSSRIPILERELKQLSEQIDQVRENKADADRDLAAATEARSHIAAALEECQGRLASAEKAEKIQMANLGPVVNSAKSRWR